MNCKKCIHFNVCEKAKNPENYALQKCKDFKGKQNRFDKSLDRIKKNVDVQDNWNEEDLEHYKTIIEALEIASKIEKGSENNA